MEDEMNDEITSKARWRALHLQFVVSTPENARGGELFHARG
jgi:hypothetical protein